MIRAVVIDDEASGIATLKMMSERHHHQMGIVASATEAKTGIAIIEGYKPDVVFLDISMPDMNGFELLAKLCFRDFKLVFVTAHQEYALKAIKNRAFDYLLKPIDDEDFLQCLGKLVSVKQPLQSESLKHSALVELPVKDGIEFLQQEEILRVEASRSYTVFYLENGVRHVASKSLKEYEAQLDPQLFYRCHYSHIINLKKVKKFVNHDGLFARMSDGSLTPISKKNKDDFLLRLKNV